MQALFLTYIWPEPTSTAAGGRTLSFLKALRKIGYDVTVGSTGENQLFRDALTAGGFKTEAFAMNDSRFDEWLLSRQASGSPIDLVIFDRSFTEEQ